MVQAITEKKNGPGARGLRLLVAFCLLLFTTAHLAFASEDGANIKNGLPPEVEAAVQSLAVASLKEKRTIVQAIAQSKNPRAFDILEAFSQGRLYQLKATKEAVLIDRADDGTLSASATQDGSALGVVGKRDVKKIRINNRLRIVIRDLLAARALFDANIDIRLNAAEQAFLSAKPEMLASLEQALADEQDAQVRSALADAKAAIMVANPTAPLAERLEAIESLKQRADQAALSKLLPFADSSDPELADAVNAAIKHIEARQAMCRFKEF